MAEDAVTDKSRGHACLQSVDSSSAQAAVEALNGAVVHGQELRASPSMPVRKRAAALDGTFCSVYVDEGALKKVFQRAGCITSTAVMRDEGGRSRGFGFVNYASAADASRALAELDGHTDAGCVWQASRSPVSAPQKKPEREADMHAKQLGGASAGRSDAARLRRQQANLYVRNLGEMASEHLRALFQEFGPIESASVLKAPDGSLRGVGFVQFIKPEDAMRALAALHNKQASVGQRTLVVEQARSKVQAARSYQEAAPSYIAAPGGVYTHAAAAPQGMIHAPYATMAGTALPIGYARNPKDAAAGARTAKGSEHGAGMPLAYGYAGFGYGYGMPMYGAPMPGYGDQRNVYGAAANGSTDGAMYAGYGAPYGAAAFGAPYGPYGTYVPVSPADMQHGSFYVPHAMPYQAYEAGRGRARTRGGRSGSSIGGGSGGGGRGMYGSSRRGGESGPSSAPGGRAGSQGGASHRGLGSSEARLPNGTHAAPASPVPSPAVGPAAAGDAPAVDAAATVVTSSAAAAGSAQAGASAPPAQKAELDEPVKERTAANSDDAGPVQPAMAKLAVSSPLQHDCKQTAKGASVMATAASAGEVEHATPAAAPALALCN